VWQHKGIHQERQQGWGEGWQEQLEKLGIFII
jgi:hypothetical protein